MATIAQYVNRMRIVHSQVGAKLGTDVSGLPKGLRASDMAILVVIAVVLKTVVDKGLVTDAELLAQLDALADGSYADEPS